MEQIKYERINSEDLNVKYTDEELKKLKECAEKISKFTIKNKNSRITTIANIISNKIYGPGVNDTVFSDEFKDSINNAKDEYKALLVAYAIFPDDDNSFLEKLQEQNINMNTILGLIKSIENSKLKDGKITTLQRNIINYLTKIIVLKLSIYYGNIPVEILLTRMNIEYSKYFKENFSNMSIEEKISFAMKKISSIKKIEDFAEVSINIDDTNTLILTYLVNTNLEFALTEEMITSVEEDRNKLAEYFNSIEIRIINNKSKSCEEETAHKIYKKEK